jgi:predicted nucleic acid-binding protein
LGCGVFWSEDLADGQRYGSVTVRNPFVWAIT